MVSYDKLRKLPLCKMCKVERLQASGCDMLMDLIANLPRIQKLTDLLSGIKQAKRSAGLKP